jgi:hypothetical protein
VRMRMRHDRMTPAKTTSARALGNNLGAPACATPARPSVFSPLCVLCLQSKKRKPCVGPTHTRTCLHADGTGKWKTPPMLQTCLKIAGPHLACTSSCLHDSRILCDHDIYA